MSLTAEQIEFERIVLKTWFPKQSDERKTFDTLCDMSLRSLTEREEGYRQGLEAAAKIAIKHPSSAGFDIAKDIRGANEHRLPQAAMPEVQSQVPDMDAQRQGVPLVSLLWVECKYEG